MTHKWVDDIEVKNYHNDSHVYLERFTTREFDSGRDTNGIKLDFVREDEQGRRKTECSFVMTKRQWTEFRKRINEILK